jgi:FMN-dependent NADH-azoreductase
MKILHIDSSASGAASVSRELTAATVKALREANPTATVSYRDLVAAPPAHLDGALLQSLRPQPGVVLPSDEHFHKEVAYTDALLNEFLAADVIVLGVPMVNFSIPSQLKAWIDRVAQAGKTFRYTAEGPEGLAKGKKVVLVSARGGKYAGTPVEAMLDHQEAYLRAVLGFLGITDVSVLRAEGVAFGPDVRAQVVADALAQAGAIAGELAAA